VRHFIYLEAPDGTVHLAEFERYHFFDARTLCEARSTTFDENDETASGHRATCKTCLTRKDAL
jgi:hypothetical protein